MTKYISDPVTVDAFEIKQVEVRQIFTVTLDNGVRKELTDAQVGSIHPTAGDYLISPENTVGYESVAAKRVFETEYTKIEE